MLRSKWSDIVAESKLVAQEMCIDADFPYMTKHRTKVIDYFDIIQWEQQEMGAAGSNSDISDENYFCINVFNVILDTVIGGLSTGFKSVGEIVERFGFIWKYPALPDDD